jgi:uncharacterized protein YgiM (DUF1202 family)
MATATPVVTSTTAARTDRLVFNGDVDTLVQRVTSLSGGFAPAAVARVISPSLSVRQRPTEAAPAAGQVNQGDALAVLGKNEDGAWLYVLTGSLVQGWLPANTLQTIVPLGQAPALPDDPLAQHLTPAPAATPTPAPILASTPTLTATPPAAAASLSPDLSPAAAFVTTADNVSVRQGPGTNFPSNGVVQKGDLGGVLGANRNGDWLYVITANGTLGWLPADAVRLLGSPDEATALPPNPVTPEIVEPAATVAAALPPTAPPSQPTATTVPAAQPAVEPLAVAQLQPVTSAQVDSDLLNMRQGPGPEYPALGTLRRTDRVTILAVNRTRDWALVKTAGDQVAWVWLSFLRVTGDLSAAPQVISSPPGGDFPAGQVAPIFSEKR